MKRVRIGVVAAMLAGFAGGALAGTEVPYDQAAFTAAQQQGRPVVVFVTAPWCPVCAKQHPIVTKLSADPALAGLQVFDVDFDSQKDLLRTMGVRQQSTLIVFHGATEVGRSTGETDEGALRALLLKSNG